MPSKKTQLTLSCSKGFSYITPNEVVATIGKVNVSPQLYWLIQAYEVFNRTDMRDIKLGGSRSTPALIVPHGESFTPGDFADYMTGIIALDMVFVDGSLTEKHNA